MVESFDDSYQLQTACGVFGCIASGEWPAKINVAQNIYLGLVGLQHRGQESAGIVTFNNGKMRQKKDMGLVNQVFTDDILDKLRGDLGIGHTRYSTTGVSEMINCQPFVVDSKHGRFALAHNGELVNAKSLRQKVLADGVGLSSESDSELMTQLLCRAPDDEGTEPDWPTRIRNFMKMSLTAYSALLLYKDRIYAFRDPYGNRPLCIGKLVPPDLFDGEHNDADLPVDGWILSSESAPFYCMGAKYYREVMPGEIICVSRDGVKSCGQVPRLNGEIPAVCIFEYVYFARPDSILENQMVYSVRRRCGMQLSIEAPQEADIVSSVPESGNAAALGFAHQSGLPFVEILAKNRYVGRTFINPDNRLRKLGVAKKFGALSDNFLGKKVILVDDSIVRGNTLGPIVRLLRKAGAKEVHVRIASPPLRYPCYMGINIPTKEELVANSVDPSDLAAFFGADTVVHLSVAGLTKSVEEGIKDRPVGHCTACLTGKYPVPVDF